MNVRSVLCLLILLALILPAHAFEEDFETNLDQWVNDNWERTDEDSYTGDWCLTDSPGQDPYPDETYWEIYMAEGADLTEAMGAELSFWVAYDVEPGFDFWYVDASNDGGDTWNNLGVFDGYDNDWEQMTFDLGGYVGFADVRVRFWFETDANTGGDGIWIDDVAITILDEDTSPPLVIHEPVSEEEAVPDAFDAVFTVLDISGVDYVNVYYTANGGDEVEAQFTELVGESEYHFSIPRFPAATKVEYRIEAGDLAETPNEGEAGPWYYYCGIMLVNDNGVGNDQEYVYNGAAGHAKASFFEPPEEDDIYIAALLIRFYTDEAPEPREIDTADVVIWSDLNEMPDEELIDPIAFWPQCTPLTPHILSFVDLREYEIPADANFHGGFYYRSEEPWILGDGTNFSGNSKIYNGTSWSNATADWHFRAIVGTLAEPEELSIEDIQTMPDMEGAYVRTSGIVTLPIGTTFDNRTEVYIQDPESGYGLYLFDWTIYDEMVRGAELEVTGIVDDMNGNTRIVDFDYTVLSEGNPMPEPIILSTAEMALNQAMEGSWAQITGILQEEPGEPNQVFNVNDGSGNCQFRLWDATGIDMSGYSQYDGIRVRGPITIFNTEVVILPSLVVDIEESPGLEAPTNLDGTINQETGEVSIDWEYDAGAFGFNHLDNELDEFLDFIVYRNETAIDTTDQTTYTETLTEFGMYSYSVRAHFDEGLSDFSNVIDLEWIEDAVGDGEMSGIPDEFEVSGLYPNPFNSTVNIVVGIPTESEIHIDVYNILGQSVQVLHQGRLNPGYHTLSWQGDGFPTGMYFIHATSGTGWHEVQKVMLMK